MCLLPAGLGASDDQGMPVSERKNDALPVSLNAKLQNLLDGRNFATLATLNPDGSPQTSVVWILREDDTLLVSVTQGKQKTRNLARDPRVSIALYDLANPYDSVEIRGLAELVEDPTKWLPTALSHKYLGVDPPAESDAEVRLIVRVTPTKVNGFSAAV